MLKPRNANIRAARDTAGTRQVGFYEKMYARISELAKIGVWECDLATEALTWTDAVYDLFELPRQSKVSRATTLELYEQGSREEMERRRAHAIATCSTFTVDVAVKTARGNPRWIRITGDVEHTDGRAERIFGTKQDITTEKMAQLQIQALQTELIHLSRLSAMDAMNSAVGHELNQPLTAITAYVAALRRMLVREHLDPMAMQEVMSGIESCALKAGTIMHNLSKMPLGGQLSASSFDLSAAIREASVIGLAGVPQDLSFKCRIEPHVMAIGDPIQIQQVVINLIKYAREALSRSERMQLTISMLEKDGMAEVSFHNSGPGIPAGGIATLFDTLALNNSDVTSLGLSISRTIVEAHSGKLTAQNHAEGGSTFIFTIPLASPARTGRV